MFAKLASRKLWAAVAAAALAAFGQQLGIPDAAIERIVDVVIGYIVGQGVVDAAAAFRVPRN